MHVPNGVYEKSLRITLTLLLYSYLHKTLNSLLMFSDTKCWLSRYNPPDHSFIASYNPLFG